jgi:predicted oxidoreductase
MARIAQEQQVDFASVAVAWIMAHPANIMPVMGTNNISRIQNLSEANRVEMDRETWFELYTAALGNEVP